MILYLPKASFRFEKRTLKFIDFVLSVIFKIKIEAKVKILTQPESIALLLALFSSLYLS